MYVWGVGEPCLCSAAYHFAARDVETSEANPVSELVFRTSDSRQASPLRLLTSGINMISGPPPTRTDTDT